MLPLQTNSETYWTEKFQVTQDDLEFLYNLFLEEETPLRTPDLIQRLIAYRINSEIRTYKKHLDRGEIFKPAGSYKVGQELVFPAFGYAIGSVVNSRPGKNPLYGDFNVIEVEFEDGRKRDLACDFQAEHKLNVETQEPLTEKKPEPERVYQRYKRTLTPIVVEALHAVQDMVFIAGRWFLKSLMVQVNEGYLNLAEAVLDLNDGGPNETKEIAEQIGFASDANPILRSVSLDYGLAHDNRFDEVGPAGKVWWFLKRMEPAEIQTPPQVLRYDPIQHNPNALTDELIDLVIEIDDELSIQEELDEEEMDDNTTITLLYPHWRMGTLPLTQRVDYLLPMAYRAPRIKITLVDAKGNREMNGWVVREYGYVYGLDDFYERHSLPVGALVTITPDENDSSRLVIDFLSHKPRNEFIWLAKPGKERLQFEEGQQMIGARYDDLMVLGIQDLEGLDTLATRYRQRNVELSTLMSELMGELAQFSPQRFVHAKTLYSAVNLLRRCPPEPIFATLVTHPNFVHAGGLYWQLAQR